MNICKNETSVPSHTEFDMKGFLLLDWTALVAHIETLADMIKESGEKFDGIVTVASGGLTIATLLHDFTGLPVATYTANSYVDIGVVGEYTMKFQIGGKFNGDRVLFVDDVSEHGKTFLRGLEHLEGWGTKNVKTAAVFLKPWSKYTPDFVAAEVDKWVIFPFEYYETVKDLFKKWAEEGLSNIQIWARFRELGIPSNYTLRYAREMGLTKEQIERQLSLPS